MIIIITVIFIEQQNDKLIYPGFQVGKHLHICYELTVAGCINACIS